MVFVIFVSFCDCNGVSVGTELKGKGMEEYTECFVSVCSLGIMVSGLMQINYSVITSVVVVGSADDGVVLFVSWIV